MDRGIDAFQTDHPLLDGGCHDGKRVDQVLPHPSDPRLCASYMKSAVGYVEPAEEMNGPIPKPADYSYIWGEAFNELNRRAPDVKIVNLETAVTTSKAWQEKGINYRMHPENIPCLTAVRIERVPFQMKRFRLHRASDKDARWLEAMFNRESEGFGVRVALKEDYSLKLRWDEEGARGKDPDR